MLSVIMAGGVGERFWPQSRRSRPKQLLDLTGEGSMISLTVGRLNGLSKPEETFVITNVAQRDAILTEVSGLVPPENVIGEPVGQNTAPCIGLAAMLLQRMHGVQPMFVLPADHVVEPVAAFQRLVSSAADYVTVNGGLLTFGIQPTRPETGYGYIRADEPVVHDGQGEVFRAGAFLEKPDAQTAAEFIEAGNYFWNSGMFMWRTDTILSEIGRHMPDLAAILAQIESRLGTEELADVLKPLYPKTPAISIDYGIMEKADDVVVMKSEFEWNDVGSWEFIRDVHPADDKGNVVVGDHVLIDSSNNTIVSPERLVGVIGVDDLVIVDGGDTILICKRDRVQDVKHIVQKLRDNQKDALT